VVPHARGPLDPNHLFVPEERSPLCISLHGCCCSTKSANKFAVDVLMVGEGWKLYLYCAIREAVAQVGSHDDRNW